MQRLKLHTNTCPLSTVCGLFYRVEQSAFKHVQCNTHDLLSIYKCFVKRNKAKTTNTRSNFECKTLLSTPWDVTVLSLTVCMCFFFHLISSNCSFAMFRLLSNFNCSRFTCAIWYNHTKRTANELMCSFLQATFYWLLLLSNVGKTRNLLRIHRIFNRVNQLKSGVQTQENGSEFWKIIIIVHSECKRFMRGMFGFLRIPKSKLRTKNRPSAQKEPANSKNLPSKKNRQILKKA